jgi:hypothetical protein
VIADAVDRRIGEASGVRNGGVMASQTHPKEQHGAALSRPQLRLIESSSRGRARFLLLTYVVGNAFFWALLGAVSVSADHWYWWPVVPLVGWTLVLELHLRHVLRGASR